MLSASHLSSATGVTSQSRDTRVIADLARRVLSVEFAQVILLEDLATGAAEPLAYCACLSSVVDHALTSGTTITASETCTRERCGKEVPQSRPHWRALAGVPLRDPRGAVGGVFCAGDTTPRQWAASELDLLQHLGQSFLAERWERQRAEEATRAARDTAYLLNDVDAIVWEADAASFQFTFISDQAERLLGYPSEAWAQPGFWSHLIHPDDRERTVQLCAHASVEGRDHELEYRAIAADGRVVWLKDLVRVVRDETGSVSKLRGVMVDVTAEKVATSDLQQISDRGRCILWTAEVRESEGELDWSSLRVSNEEAAQRLLPLTLLPGQSYADAWYDSKSEEDRARMAEISDLALREGHSSYRQEYQCLGRDGETRWFLEEAFAERQGPGRWHVTGISTEITQRKEAEFALIESERRYRSLTENATDQFFILDREGRISYQSPSTLRLLGYHAQELFGKPLVELIHPEDRPDVGAFLHRTLARRDQELECTSTYRLRTPNGNWRYLESTGINLLDDAAIRGVVVNSRDVTQRVQMRADLQYAMAHAQCILWHAEITEAAGDELDWRITLPDPTAAQRFFPLEITLGKSYYQAWLETRLPGDRERSQAIAEANVRANRSFSQEFRCRDATGAVRWLREAVQVEPTGSSRWRAVGVCTDVTEQREAEAALREQDELLRHVMEAAKDIIWTWDLITGDVHHFGAIEAVLGYELTEEQLGFAWWQSCLHPDDRERTINSFLTAVREEAPNWTDEYRFRRADGTYAIVLDRAYYLRNAEGRPRRIIGVMMDVSRYRQAEERLRQAQKMEAVGRLAGGIAHDFNNMLAVINGYCELLLSGNALPVPARGPLEEVQKAGERAASLTRQLLAFGRKQLVSPDALDLSEVVRSVEQMLRGLIREQIRMEVRIAGEPARVYADRGQMEQALVNLVVNARDAMPQGGQLTIELQRTDAASVRPEARGGALTGPYVLLTVADTGTGISDEILPHIFEPFFTTKNVGQGTGLGLATVYAIVQQSRGFVEVDSQPGRGTAFRIYLPALDQPGATVPPPALPTSVGGSETILVAEDESMLRRLVADLLRAAGYQVLLAGSREAALSIAEAHPGTIHLLLTDVVMPGGSGHELASELKSWWRELAVLYTSSHTADAVLQQNLSQDLSMDLSMDETSFLQKPFSPAELLTKVRSVLDQTAIARQE